MKDVLNISKILFCIFITFVWVIVGYYYNIFIFFILKYFLYFLGTFKLVVNMIIINGTKL